MVLTCLEVFVNRRANECIAQAEGHYYIMVQHVWDSMKNRDVMRMWKLGGSGPTVMYQVGCIVAEWGSSGVW